MISGKVYGWSELKNVPYKILMNRLYLRSTEGCGSKKEEEIGSRKQGGELDGTEDPE